MRGATIDESVRMRRTRVTAFIASWITRPMAIVQVLLGLFFWTGHALGLVRLHMLIGALFVVSLWMLAALGGITRSARTMSLVVALWGALVLALGVSQGRLLPGPMHWVVRLLHLIVGIVAMRLARRLAAHVRAAEAPLRHADVAVSAPSVVESYGDAGR